MARVEVNSRAPDFSLPNFDGKEISLSDFNNKRNVLVVFNRGFV